jgi:hypothetical protein
MNNGVAACGFYFDPTDYYRQAITNMEGRPRLNFVSCKYVHSLLQMISAIAQKQQFPQSQQGRQPYLISLCQFLASRNPDYGRHMNMTAYGTAHQYH